MHRLYATIVSFGLLFFPFIAKASGQNFDDVNSLSLQDQSDDMLSDDDWSTSSRDSSLSPVRIRRSSSPAKLFEGIDATHARELIALYDKQGQIAKTKSLSVVTTVVATGERRIQTDPGPEIEPRFYDKLFAQKMMKPYLEHRQEILKRFPYLSEDNWPPFSN